MQVATVTVKVYSSGDYFKSDESDIVEKAILKLKDGEFTADIEDKIR